MSSVYALAHSLTCITWPLAITVTVTVTVSYCYKGGPCCWLHQGLPPPKVYLLAPQNTSLSSAAALAYASPTCALSHCDALVAGSMQVDVVAADASSQNELQLGRRLDALPAGQEGA